MLALKMAYSYQGSRVFLVGSLYFSNMASAWQQLYTCKHLVLLTVVFQPKTSIFVTKKVFFRNGDRIGISRACIAGKKKKVTGQSQ